VVLRTIHRVAAKELNVKDSARLRQRLGLDPSAAALNSERRPGYVSLAVHRLRARLPAKRAARENEARAPMVNLADNHGAERRLQPSVPPNSQSAERKSPKDQHQRQGHNNSGAIFTAAPEQKLRSRSFVCELGHCPRIVFSGPALIIEAPDAR